MTQYKDYWWRWIKYDRAWEKFENFENDMYEKYLVHIKENGWDTSIDRINNEWGYSKENCKWATAKEQARNRRNSNLVEYKWESKTLPEWAEIMEIKSSTLRQRYYVYKWDIDKCMTYGRNTPSNLIFN